MNKSYDVIVVGAGHAGCEAALAAARCGVSVLFVTHNVEKIAAMSCNPAIGGTAKGHLVKEIDALGGEMGKAIDATGIQFRLLNRKKGPAIWSSRAQADMNRYSSYMKKIVEETANLHLKQDSVDELIYAQVEDQVVITGIRTKTFGAFFAKTVVLTTGTFLNGLIHIGETKISAGRASDQVSISLGEFIKKMGFRVGRLKTGTTPRLDAKTIDFSKLIVQDSDENIIPFSFMTDAITQKLVPCYITYTNDNTHEVIRQNIARSPMYSGEIKSLGPRYCPSIEDKVVRFKEKLAHQIFLEPQGYDTCEVYPNGLSTSLPLEVQIAFLRTIEGLENVEIIRPGYAIEYDFVDPTELYNTLETKKVKNLFFAGQINGTTGYEEAGAQGLIAGINASCAVREIEPLVLSRSDAYIGVLIDDLITKGTSEPYRMFTSRAEHRLYLREDNADLRLTQKGYDIGLVDEVRFEKLLKRKALLEKYLTFIEERSIRDYELPEALKSLQDNPGTKLKMILKRPEMDLDDLDFLTDIPKEIRNSLAIETKYEGYIARELKVAQKSHSFDRIKIPTKVDYKAIKGLSNEVITKLTHFQPQTIGQASRISGITPTAIQVLQIWLKKATVKKGLESHENIA